MTNEVLIGKPHMRTDDVASAKLRLVSRFCKKLIMTVAVVTVAAWGAFGTERLSVDEVVAHYPWDGRVDCVCTLSGLVNGFEYKGAFTLTVRKNVETIRRTVTNAFDVANGTCTNTFYCTVLFDAGGYPNGGITVDLIRVVRVPDASGKPIGITGEVLVIDVSAGSGASAYPTKEYPSVDMGLFNCDVYKTDKIVLRKVPAGSYYCQPGADESMTVSQKLTVSGSVSSGPLAVGGKRPNLWGLYDMQGNIGEFCRDIYVLTYIMSDVDVPCTSMAYDSDVGRVYRGGRWMYAPEHCRPSGRGSFFGAVVMKALS